MAFGKKKIFQNHKEHRLVNNKYFFMTRPDDQKGTVSAAQLDKDNPIRQAKVSSCEFPSSNFPFHAVCSSCPTPTLAN